MSVSWCTIQGIALNNVSTLKSLYPVRTNPVFSVTELEVSSSTFTTSDKLAINLNLRLKRCSRVRFICSAIQSTITEQ